MEQYPRGTVAFVFTDLEGSTRLWEAHAEAMRVAYARHDAVLRTAVAAHGGVVYKVIGDAVQAAFPSASAAVGAALDAQRGLLAESWTALGLPGPLRVRMALHAGAVDPDASGDYRSPVLNRLGRLLSAGHGGQVLLSLAAAELSRDALPAGASLRDLGERRLKDLYRTEHIYQLLHPALPEGFPPLATLDRRPHNLPLQPTPLVGRERELMELRALLARPEVRLLTLSGPGGTGKTRLGLQLAADLIDAYDHGAYFVPLGAVTDPALVASAIAQALGVRVEGGETPEAAVADHLADKHLLLVLDNFEQVTDAAPVVADLLAAAPRLAVIVTSRAPLRVRGEQEFPVPPLALPDPKRLPALAALTQYEAVRLFVQRAVEAKPDFAVTNADAPAVAQICVRLDGLPLAIELAAARVKLLPPEALLARLDSSLKVLTGGARDLPERQRTLRGAISWSADLLSLPQQLLFARLAVFAGGWTFAAAEAVADPDGVLDAFDGLAALVDQSLVRQEEADGEPRFAMLETIREFAAEQLEQSGEAEDVRRRHADWLSSLIGAYPEYTAPQEEHRGWYDRIEAELDNLRAALGWAVERDDAETAIRLVDGVVDFWEIRGLIGEGNRWYERALALPSLAALPTEQRVNAFHGAGNIASRHGDFAQAIEHISAAIALARAEDDERRIAQLLPTLGGSAMNQGRFDVAEAAFDEALRLFENHGSRGGQAVVLNLMGELAMTQGDYERAPELLERSLALCRELGFRPNEAVALSNLGDVATRRGDFTLAAERYETARAIFGEMDDRLRAGAVQHRMARLALAEGDVDRAITWLRPALRYTIDTADRMPFSDCCQTVAGVALARDRPERAARLLGVYWGIGESLDTDLTVGDTSEYDALVAAARAQLGPEAYEAAWNAGRDMSRAEAIALALDEIGNGNGSV